MITLRSTLFTYITYVYRTDIINQIIKRSNTTMAVVVVIISETIRSAIEYIFRNR